MSLVPETSVQAMPSTMTSEPNPVSLADVSHERIQVGQEKGTVTLTPNLVPVTLTQVPCSSEVTSSTSTTVTTSYGQPICSTGIPSQSTASSRREISPTVTITPATPGPSSETMSVSMRGMMKEMVRLMQNMAKGGKGHGEAIDLSQVPKASSCSKSGRKGKSRQKRFKQVRPRESSESETTSSSECESDATSDDSHTPSMNDSPRHIGLDTTPKLPSFTGSESWKVWFNRFDDVAYQRNWSEERRLDVILPRLKGQAGEYVYDQLSCKQRSNYKELVDCLKKRFCKVESRKMFADMFWKRDQKGGELEETYAAEFKRLHGKAWPKQNLESTEGDLLQRFMNSLLDKKAKQQVEFVKNPTNIDDALDEVVKYWEARQVSSKDVGVRRHPQRVARTSPGDSSESDEDGSGSDTEVNPRVARSFGK